MYLNIKMLIRDILYSYTYKKQAKNQIITSQTTAQCP